MYRNILKISEIRQKRQKKALILNSYVITVAIYLFSIEIGALEFVMGNMASLCPSSIFMKYIIFINVDEQGPNVSEDNESGAPGIQ